ncbi:MAG: hypothetical protein ACMG6S_14280 [Byssovorax sp.]
MISTSPGAATERLHKSCDAGVAADCGALGAMYSRGSGVAKDEACAAELYRKACDGGSAAGCSAATP